MASVIAGEKVATFREGGKGGAAPAGSYKSPMPDYSWAGNVLRAAQPNTFVTSPTNATPIDFDVYYPTPLDPTEIFAMCTETSLVETIPEEETDLKSHYWRELNELHFASGTMHAYLGFLDGDCPNPYEADGDERSVTLKNIGVYKALTLSDIKHARGAGTVIRRRTQVLSTDQPRLPGVNANGMGEMAEVVAGLREKELTQGLILLLNGEDYLLAKGDKAANPLVFDGIESIVTAANGAHTNAIGTSGTFAASEFNEFLSEGCTFPDIIFGHPAALQEMMAGYFQLGFQGSQVINVASGDRIVPGFNFASTVNTVAGQLPVIADTNFTRVDSGGGKFLSSIFPLKMNHDGVQLVERQTQLPLAVQDLAPGCTAVQFEVFKKTALVVKAMCAQKRYTSEFNGRLITTCPVVG